MNYEVSVGQLCTTDFFRLFSAAGWGELAPDFAETALKNSWAVFSVKHGDEVIAMARLLGDGAMSFFLKDFVVTPEYQGQGIGKMLLEYIEQYIKDRLNPGWSAYLQLVSAKDKDGFYSACGYDTHPNDHSGPAMSKWIERKM